VLAYRAGVGSGMTEGGWLQTLEKRTGTEAMGGVGMSPKGKSPKRRKRIRLSFVQTINVDRRKRAKSPR